MSVLCAAQSDTATPVPRSSAQTSKGVNVPYAGRIVALLHSNIQAASAPAAGFGTGPAEVAISLSPDGTIIGILLTKSSGSEAWDNQVRDAIVRTHKLPLDADGKVPLHMVLSFTHP